MKKLLLFATFGFLLFFLGCSDDNEQPDEIPEDDYLKIAKTEMFFKAAGEKQSFSLYSNIEWQITVDDDSWCKVHPTKGNGNAQIVVEALDNPERKVLTNRITVRSELGEKTVDITQEAAQPYFPLLTIETAGRAPIESKENYLDATLTLQSRNHNGVTTGKLFEGKTEIRGRGNSTWGMDKKPYRLKLDKSSMLLDMPKSKHWVLLANYSDKTLMRNELAFEISRRMGFAYTPRTKYVDVVLNGKNIGNYMLCEHIRIDKDRVNVAELSPEDTDITGGYLLEIDERMGEPIWFKTKEAGMIFCVNRPEDIPIHQQNYISSYIQKVEDAIYGKLGSTVKEVPKYLDLKSFIDYFLLNEVSKNVDGNLRLSTFVYKERGDNKLYFGPVWDYDIAFGNVNYGDCERTSGWYTINTTWYKKIFEQEAFYKMMKDRWAELRNSKLHDLEAFIDILANNMKESQTKNFSYWPILNRYVWPNAVVTGSYTGEIDYLKRWLRERIAWMDQELKK